MAERRSALVEWVSTHLIQCVLAMFGLLLSFAGAAVPWMYRMGIDMAVTKSELAAVKLAVERIDGRVERIRDNMGNRQQQTVHLGDSLHHERVREVLAARGQIQPGESDAELSGNEDPVPSVVSGEGGAGSGEDGLGSTEGGHRGTANDVQQLD